MARDLKIPILDLKREYSFLKEEIQKQIKECFASQEWILGPKVGEFEKEAAQYLKVNYAIGVASGTDALVLSLQALALKLKNKEFFDKKDEIITTSFTFVATAEAIVRSGATPVFVDIDPDTFNIDPKEIKRAVTKNTAGIIPVHLYGLSCEMDEIIEIAKDNDLFVVEDTAQAFGAKFNGAKAGTIGDLGAFSFFPSKNLGGCGDGGLVVTNNSETADYVKMLRNHGQKEKYNAVYIGYNSRLDSLQAAILLAKLKCIDKFNDLRRKAADKFNAALQSIKGLKVPFEPKNSFHVYHLYTIQVSQRDELNTYLNSKGIQSRIYYPILLNKMKAFRDCKVKGALKNTEEVLSKVLTLPMYPFLQDKEIDYITRNICSFLK